MAREIAERMRCGGCGCDTAKLRAARTDEGSRERLERIEVECTQCRSVTVFRVSPAVIEVDYQRGEGDGTFCIGWSKERT